MTRGKYANIIIDISHEKVDRSFQYRIPRELEEVLEEGMCVEVPFGKGDHLRQGYVVEITDKAQFPEEKQKEVARIVTGSVSVEADAMKLAAWLKHTYGSTMIAALRTVLPVKQTMKPRENKKIVRLVTAEETISLLGESQRKHQSARVRVLEQLVRETVLPAELVTGKLNVPAATLRSLQSQGVIALESESVYRNPVKLREAGGAMSGEGAICGTAEGEPAPKESSDSAPGGGSGVRKLNPEQSRICEKVLSDYERGKRKTCLIHGITGSGKTEVYLNLIEGMIRKKKQCIVLIPEIALTYQTLLRFYKRFGERVSVMNSTLSAGEKYDQCQRAMKGELDVIIGPRSALFVPFPDLGMIIIDEEHENSYKSESMPRYHARETAQYLAQMKGAVLVLGSATPSLEACYRARKGEYELYTLTQRASGAELAPVTIVDLRKELREGNRSIFSRRLQELLRERLEKGEQSMLFLNRRGYAGFVSCRACGYVMKCPHCDVSLSQHLGHSRHPGNARSRGNSGQAGGRMVCHYCGYETAQPVKCPSCSSPYILGFKAGTQQIEQQLEKVFPGIRVLRMDADTTRRKDSYEKILAAFSSGEADVLVGTQMIVKGHDFPNVTLVGVLAADLSLNDNDYRAGERTFQLLTQAAGRAGRGQKPGEVVIQTYRPDHYSILRAASQDYDAFYEEEILYREMGGYPPAVHMMAVLITSPCEEKAQALAGRVAELIRRDAPGALTVTGPARASIGKINDIYRFVIYCKAAEYELLIRIKDRVEEKIDPPSLKQESLQFDFDPVTGY